MTAHHDGTNTKNKKREYPYKEYRDFLHYKYSLVLVDCIGDDPMTVNVQSVMTASVVPITCPSG